jgi:GTP cyclohydrolase III
VFICSVCYGWQPPNELLLYNLVSGRARELIGHNSQIQAVEFALGGDNIVSCASNIIKVIKKDKLYIFPVLINERKR